MTCKNVPVSSWHFQHRLLAIKPILWSLDWVKYLTEIINEQPFFNVILLCSWDIYWSCGFFLQIIGSRRTKSFVKEVKRVGYTALDGRCRVVGHHLQTISFVFNRREEQVVHMLLTTERKKQLKHDCPKCKWHTFLYLRHFFWHRVAEV